ncbi:uncharacterized protein LOC113324593 [Papaver somniferum]|uniref:uncharacterized protein LOC113324593 n=1 Tax=Papaver somniferum TaxID=3469 RepID=UPI000E6FAE30|nr:uncharacterized protein LOC113324593 [Papaver somniferum]
MYNKAVNSGMDKLFSLAIAYKEKIREYTDRWKKICQAIGNVDPVVSVNCYKWGFDRMSPLFVEIHGSVPTIEGDLRVIIENHVGKQPPRSEKSRDYCEYHCFNGHHTEKCKNLKITIQKLIDAGDLKHYLHNTDTEERAKRSNQVQLPEGNRTLNIISCSEATGLSLTAQIGKRLRKQFEDYFELYKIDGLEVEEHEQWINAPITFDAEDVEDDMEDHNDPLVLTLSIAGCNTTKVLIDGGSSVNVLLYDTFKRMELNDEQLMSSYYTIYGFNGAPTKPLGDIVLQVNA